MSRSLSDVITESKGIVEKTVKLYGGDVAVHFRRLTAGQRLQLLHGQKMSRSGGVMSYELDLALNEEQRQKFVQFTVCNADGTSYFKDIAAVQSVGSKIVEALYAAASGIDKEEDKDAPEKS